MERICRHPVTAIVATIAAVAAVVDRLRHLTILGMDSYPAIASGMMRGPADLIAILTSPAVPGRVPYSYNGFYRPLATASWGFDHVLWGVEPFGFHLTHALWFGACALALYALARRLMGPQSTIGPLFALIVFLALPSHVEILVVVARRSEFLCGLMCLIALSLQATRADRPMPRGAALPAIFTLLAILSKATGLVVVPLLPLVVFTMTTRAGMWPRIRQTVLAAIPHALAAVAAVAIQVVILGQVGGHIMSRPSGAIDRFGWAFRQLIGWLVVPQPALVESTVTWALLAALVAAASLAALLALRRRSPASAALAAAGPAFAVGSAWIIGLSALYGAVGLLQSWYVFIPALAFSLTVGALAEALSQIARLTTGPAKVAALTALGLSVLWFGWLGRYSMVVSDYAVVSRNSEVTERYLDDLRARIETARDGERISVPPPPKEVVPQPGELRMGAPLAIPAYACQSWADAAFPERTIRVLEKKPRSRLPDADPDSLTVVIVPASSASRRPGRGRLRSRPGREAKDTGAPHQRKRGVDR